MFVLFSVASPRLTAVAAVNVGVVASVTQWRARAGAYAFRGTWA